MKRFREIPEWLHVAFDCVAVFIVFASLTVCAFLLAYTFNPEFFK